MDTIIEVLGLISGLLYLFYEIKHSEKMWIVGVVTAIVYIYIFATAKLYASMSYQIYYLLMSFYGIYNWRRDSKGRESVVVLNNMKWPEAIVSIIISVLIFGVVYFLLKDYLDDSMPLLDSVVTTLSLLATYWLSKSWIYQWWIWVIVNALSVVMFISQTRYISAALYLFYGVAAIFGYYYWKKEGVVSK